MTIRPDPVLRRLEASGIRLGLDVMRRVLAALGEPQRRVPAVLVGGTNGKGSTAALLAAMAGAAGYRTGLYTSPHLERPEERIRVGGRAVAPERLAELLDAVLAAAAGAGAPEPTYFEALTAAAFLAFAAADVELAVLEVGMGGRLDATNVAEPVVALVAPIALDHREHLGPTLAAIAGEKAGIFRAGGVAWSAPQPEEAAAALRAGAAALGTRLDFLDAGSVVARRPRGWEGQTVSLRTLPAGDEVGLGLLGPHQAANLALAAAGAGALYAAGWGRLDGAAVRAGAAACRWPGRLEPVLLPDGGRVVFDGAHNPAGVAAVLDFLAEVDEPVDLLFGVLADKEIDAMLPPLLRRTRRATLTTAPSPRAVAAADLLRHATGGEVAVEPEPGTALRRAVAAAVDGVLLVCGSLYLVGAARTALRQRYGVPPAAAAVATGPAETG